MKRTFLFLILLPGAIAGADVLDVRCGIPPLLSVVRAVGGEQVRADSLMNSSQDPHTYTPSPKSVAEARAADLFFTAGMPFERTVADKLQAMNPQLSIVDLSDGIEEAGDPHIWMSLPALSAMAGRIERALAAADPGGAALYRSNCEAFQRQLTQRHEALTRKLAPLRGVTFYVYHPVFGYFARDYELKQAVVELDGKSPSPRQLLTLINRAREEDVRAVFVQPQFNQRPARIVAERIGGIVLSIDPLDEDPVAVIEQSAEQLIEAYANKKSSSSH
jgi:zinc transport system substrate-binding protein